MWLVHDLPAYGLLSRQQTKSYKGCPVCGSETYAEHSSFLRKMVYLDSRRFLHLQHRFRNARRAFNGKPERAPLPKCQSGQDVYNNGVEHKDFLRGGGVEDCDDDLVKKHGVKRVNIFFKLPY